MMRTAFVVVLASILASSAVWAAPPRKTRAVARPSRPSAPPPVRPVSPPPVAPRASEAEAVDLSKLDVPAAVPVASPVTARASAAPAWKAYFDLLLISRPGVQSLTFANIHSFLFLDLFSSGVYQLSFDVSSAWGSPNFFQFDYKVFPRLTLSLGKIWIPFDDMDPHHMFGGLVGVVQDLTFIQPDQQNFFLPTLWAELGVGVKYQVLDTQALNLVSHFYVVNGFQDGGVDPKGVLGANYPSFRGYGMQIRDNNDDKAIGGRLHATIGGKLGVGASIYTARWNDSTEPEAQRLMIFEADAQLRLATAILRAGATQMTVDLPTGSYQRGGYYGELGVSTRDRRWKVLGRQGSVQLDNRVNDPTDQSWVTGKILYKPDLIQWSISYSYDLLEREGKTGRQIASLRAVMEF